MTAGNVFFIVCSLVALIGAVATVAAKSPIRSAVGLLTTIFGIAGLFLKLNAQFLAAIQLIVYAGAVVVLFVFVIMLIGPDATGVLGHPARARSSRVIGGALLGLLAIGVGVLLLGSGAEPTRFAVARPEHGSVEAVGRLMFTRGLVPFELATALLIVAVVGAIAVARSRHVARPKKQSDSPTRRLFHGPLHPRDAGRPLPKEGIL
jgi:NADH-quinone oxidoreductase subunit J